MPNSDISALIAHGLREGIEHPGDPDNDVPPRTIALPVFKPRPGMPSEMGDLVTGTASLLGEAIVHLIESEGQSEIVPRGEVKTLRRAAGEVADGPQMAAVYCRCDRARTDPLMILTASDDPDVFLVDGPMTIRGLSQRAVQHPHVVESKADRAQQLQETLTALIDKLPLKTMPRKARVAVFDAMSDFVDGES